jgi:hypothetical protein
MAGSQTKEFPIPVGDSGGGYTVVFSLNGYDKDEKVSGTKTEFSLGVSRIIDGPPVTEVVPIYQKVELTGAGGTTNVMYEECLERNGACAMPLDIDGDGYYWRDDNELSGALSPMSFRISPAAFQDSSTIAIKLSATVFPVAYCGATFPDGRPFCSPHVENGAPLSPISFTHTFTLKAWNKLQLFGTDYKFENGQYSLEQAFTRVSNYIESDYSAGYSNYSKDPQPHSLTASGWLDIIADGTAIAGLIHGFPTELAAPDINTGNLSSSQIEQYIISGKSANKLPGYAFAHMYSCKTIDYSNTVQEIPYAFGFPNSVETGVYYAGFSTSIPVITIKDGMNGTGFAVSFDETYSLIHHAEELRKELEAGKTAIDAVEAANERYTPIEPVSLDDLEITFFGGLYVVTGYEPSPMRIEGDGFARLEHVSLSESELNTLPDIVKNKAWVRLDENGDVVN